MVLHKICQYVCSTRIKQRNPPSKVLIALKSINAKFKSVFQNIYRMLIILFKHFLKYKANKNLFVKVHLEVHNVMQYNNVKQQYKIGAKFFLTNNFNL